MSKRPDVGDRGELGDVGGAVVVLDPAPETIVVVLVRFPAEEDEDDVVDIVGTNAPTAGVPATAIAGGGAE